MLLSEYNEALHIASEKEIIREEGREEERANTEREKQRADAAEQRIAELQSINDVLRLQRQGKTEGEIAEIKGISVDEVNRILSEE